MANIFISYKTEDRADAKLVADALAAKGLTVWWDPGIKGGEVFGDRIKQEIDQADAVVVVWSGRSVDSTWVQREAGRGHDQKKLLPVTFERVAKPPHDFSMVHVVNLHDWSGNADAPEIQSILDGLAQIKSGDYESDNTSGRIPPLGIDWLVSNLDKSVGGLPYGRLLVGSLLYALCIMIVAAIGRFVNAGSVFPELFFTNAAMFWVGVILVRGMHQFVAVSRGKGVRRFLDRGFTFWTMFSIIAAIIILAIEGMLTGTFHLALLFGLLPLYFAGVMLAIVTVRFIFTFLMFVLARLD